MSPTENKKLMRDIFAAVACERSMFIDHLADDVTMTVTGQYSWSQTFRGKESVLRDLLGYVASRVQDTRRTVPFRFLAGDDRVVIEAIGDMVTKEGERYDNDYCLLYRLRNEKIVENS